MDTSFSEVSLGEPQRCGSLLVYPVLGRPGRDRDCMLLDQAPAIGAVSISRSRGIDGESSLTFENRSGRRLLLLAGQLVEGRSEVRVLRSGALLKPGQRARVETLSLAAGSRRGDSSLALLPAQQRAGWSDITATPTRPRDAGEAVVPLHDQVGAMMVAGSDLVGIELFSSARVWRSAQAAVIESYSGAARFAPGDRSLTPRAARVLFEMLRRAAFVANPRLPATRFTASVLADDGIPMHLSACTRLAGTQPVMRPAAAPARTPVSPLLAAKLHELVSRAANNARQYSLNFAS